MSQDHDITDAVNRATAALVVLDKLVRDLGGSLPDLPSDRDLVLIQADAIRASATRIIHLLGWAVLT
jgi:hypothetical protein